MHFVEDVWRQLAEIRLHRAILATVPPVRHTDAGAWQAAARRASCLCPVCGQSVSGGLAGYEQHRRQSTRCRRSKASILRQWAHARGRAAPVAAWPGREPPHPSAVEVVSASLASWAAAQDPMRKGAARPRSLGPTWLPAGGEASPHHLLCQTKEPRFPLKAVPSEGGPREPIRYVI